MSVSLLSASNGDARPRLLAVSDAAVYLGLSPKTLANWRTIGRGPAFRRHGGRILYAVADLDAWSAARTFRSTSEADAAAA